MPSAEKSLYGSHDSSSDTQLNSGAIFSLECRRARQPSARCQLTAPSDFAREPRGCRRFAPALCAAFCCSTRSNRIVPSAGSTSTRTRSPGRTLPSRIRMRQRILHQPLHRAAQRARSVGRIVAVGENQRRAPRASARCERCVRPAVAHTLASCRSTIFSSCSRPSGLNSTMSSIRFRNSGRNACAQGFHALPCARAPDPCLPVRTARSNRRCWS